MKIDRKSAARLDYLALAFWCPIALTIVLACPASEADHPTRDSTNEPADGETGAPK